MDAPLSSEGCPRPLDLAQTDFVFLMRIFSAYEMRW